MNPFVNAENAVWFVGLSLAFLALLVHAWLRRSAFSRLAALGLSLFVLFFASPNLYRALRSTMSLAERDRVSTNLWTDRPATPFESGVFTMYREAQRDVEQDAAYRDLAMAALVALATLPAFPRRQARALSRDKTSVPSETVEPLNKTH